MAGIAAPGLGSGLDVNGIISQLMAVESQPLAKLDRKEAVYQAEISGYGGLKSALSSLQSSLAALKKPETFHATSGSSSDESVFSVSTDTDAAPSSYDITVNRLAQRHKLGASEFAATDTFGGGVDDALTILIGSDSFSVDLSTAMTLEQIQAAINVETNETGITAGLITGDSGNQTLVLTSARSGYENRVQLAFGGAIDAATFNFATLNRDADGQLLAADTALDASLLVDGVTVTRGSNSISDVVDGLTLDLKGEGHAVAAIDKNPAVASNAVNGFIKAYNELKDQMSSLSTGTLSGNSLLRGVESQVRGVLNQSLSGLGDFSYISQLGITSNAETGRLQLDSEMLNSALEDSVGSVAAFFSDEENGFAVKMDGVLDGFLQSGGMIDSVIDGANSRIDTIDDRRDTLERRLEAIERRYRNQFTALDTMMARLTTTSDYLTLQLDNLSSMLKDR
jgi:flagellar hook-associated protein 2